MLQQPGGHLGHIAVGPDHEQGGSAQFGGNSVLRVVGPKRRVGESEHTFAVAGQNQAFRVKERLGQDELLEDLGAEAWVQSRLPRSTLPDRYHGRRVGIAEMAEMDAFSGQERHSTFGIAAVCLRANRAGNSELHREFERSDYKTKLPLTPPNPLAWSFRGTKRAIEQ